MSVFKPRFVLLALACALAPTLFGSGCAGGAFETSERAAGGSSAGAGDEQAGNVAAGASDSGKACSGPAECDDGQVCTTDFCSADGTCASAPKCLGTQLCCDGDCAECCSDRDCDDDVGCTENTCFMGQCLYVPNDSACEQAQYCSAKADCRPRQPCGSLPGEDALKVCDDDDGCTTDSCGADHFCAHDYCAKLCCPGAAAACADDCCSDAQCDTDHKPCTVGLCRDGKCSVPEPLCAEGEVCCPSPDGMTATCGACCTASDCDDHNGCTVDSCSGNQCSHTPGKCDEPGYYCDVEEGCIKSGRCDNAGGCAPPTPCQINPQCENGACKFDSCSDLGEKCCKGSGCGLCCSNDECSDHVDCTADVCGPAGCAHTPKNALCAPTQICDAELGCIECQTSKDCDDGLPCTTDACDGNKCSHTGTCGKLKFCTATGCAACVKDSDCQLGSTNVAIGTPGCTVTRCVSGTCESKTETCDVGFCCPPYGCLPQCLQTK